MIGLREKSILFVYCFNFYYHVTWLPFPAECQLTHLS